MLQRITLHLARSSEFRKGVLNEGMRSLRQLMRRAISTRGNGESSGRNVASGVFRQRKAIASACFSTMREARVSQPGAFIMMGRLESAKRREFIWRHIASPRANISLFEIREVVLTLSRSIVCNLSCPMAKQEAA